MVEEPSKLVCSWWRKFVVKEPSNLGSLLDYFMVKEPSNLLDYFMVKEPS